MANLNPPPLSGDPSLNRWLNILWQYVIRLFVAPSQAGNAGKYLMTNGATTSWATVSSGGTPLNVINTDTTIASDTSYIIVDYLTVNADLTIDGNLGII